MTSLTDLTATTPGLPCRTDPDPFFSPNPVERSYAARQCHRCPLLLECMRYALAADEQYGVWGGVDMEARAMGCGTERGYQIHIRRKEPVCPLCRAAHDERVEANRRHLLEVAHRAGGTTRGYWMHRRLGEEACEGCKRAQGRRSAERRERQRATAGRPRRASAASGMVEPLLSPHAAVQPLALAG
ncbi:WhiB family transcriptional regulator [Streptomyces pseudovenezuelae]|uniref:WhiB family transcriptional regulator n=1 Tax=Streptomyces pseudovenezuelae TaxID=67350 RepID=UPI002E2EDD86|nr:WhiB family transcriptional regulator [Streptomyces pseudovenezuelae]